MKQDFKMIRNFMFLCLGVSAAVLYSCGNNGSDDEPDPIVEEPEVSVHFGYSVDVSEEPMLPRSASRADEVGSNDLIGISIWQKKIYNENLDYWSNSEQYAYGVFDDINKMTFKLNKGRIYYIHLLYYPDAKNIVYKKSDNTYGVPFNSDYLKSPAYKLNEPKYYSPELSEPGFSAFSMLLNLYQNSPSGLQKDCVRGTTPIYMGFRELKVEDDSNVDIRLSSCLMGIKLNCSNFSQGKLILDYKMYDRKIEFSPGDEMIDRVQVCCPYEETSDFSGYGKFFKDYNGEDIRLYYQPNNEQTYLIATKNLKKKPNTTYVFNFDLEKRADGSFGILVPGENDYVEENASFD